MTLIEMNERIKNIKDEIINLDGSIYEDLASEKLSPKIAYDLGRLLGAVIHLIDAVSPPHPIDVDIKS